MLALVVLIPAALFVHQTCATRRAIGYDYRDDDPQIDTSDNVVREADFAYFRILTGGELEDNAWGPNSEVASQAMLSYGPILTAAPYDRTTALFHARRLARIWLDPDNNNPSPLLLPALELNAERIPLCSQRPLGFQERLRLCQSAEPSKWRYYIRTFLDEFEAETGRLPFIKTSVEFLRLCVGDTSWKIIHAPLWLEDFEAPLSEDPPLPPGWTTWTMWSHHALGAPRETAIIFNRSPELLHRLAREAHTTSTAADLQVTRTGTDASTCRTGLGCRESAILK